MVRTPAGCAGPALDEEGELEEEMICMWNPLYDMCLATEIGKAGALRATLSLQQNQSLWSPIIGRAIFRIREISGIIGTLERFPFPSPSFPLPLPPPPPPLE